MELARISPRATAAIDVVIPVCNAAADLARGVESALAHAAQRRRHTRPGRVLSRLTPDGVVDALRARSR